MASKFPGIPGPIFDPNIIGPDPLELGSEFISLACITVLAVALGIKTDGEKLKSLNYGRALVIILYFFSWAFSVTSIVIVSTNNGKLSYINSLFMNKLSILTRYY